MDEGTITVVGLAIEELEIVLLLLRAAQVSHVFGGLIQQAGGIVVDVGRQLNDAVAQLP